MAQTPEQKAAKYLIDACADSRFNEVAFANRMTEEKYDIQVRFWNIYVSYIFNNAHNYEYGVFPNETYEISRLSKKIKDYVFSDEPDIPYPVYGDYEIENLTLFDYQ